MHEAVLKTKVKLTKLNTIDRIVEACAQKLDQNMALIWRSASRARTLTKCKDQIISKIKRGASADDLFHGINKDKRKEKTHPPSKTKRKDQNSAQINEKRCRPEKKSSNRNNMKRDNPDPWAKNNGKCQTWNQTVVSIPWRQKRGYDV